MALQTGSAAAQQNLWDALASFSDPLQQLRSDVTNAAAPTRLGRKQAPYTIADALTQVTAREEAKRKALANRKDGKKSSKLRPGVTPPHDAFRGAVQGGGSEPSAFWMVMEDYFRDITREDLLELLPAYPDPSQDPAFLVPLLGRPHDAPAPEAGGFGSAPDSAAGRSQAQTPAPRAPAGLFDAEDLGSGRRSSRLTARTVKAAEDVRLAEQTAAEAAEAAAAANAFAGPPGGCLLDACSAAELALIANQVLELRASVPEAHSSTEPPRAVTQAAAAVSFDAGGELDSQQLEEAERQPLQVWLAEQGAAVLAASQPPAGHGNAGVPAAASDGVQTDGPHGGDSSQLHVAHAPTGNPRLRIDWDELMRPPPPLPPLPPSPAPLHLPLPPLQTSQAGPPLSSGSQPPAVGGAQLTLLPPAAPLTLPAATPIASAAAKQPVGTPVATPAADAVGQQFEQQAALSQQADAALHAPVGQQPQQPAANASSQQHGPDQPGSSQAPAPAPAAQHLADSSTAVPELPAVAEQADAGPAPPQPGQTAASAATAAAQSATPAHPPVPGPPAAGLAADGPAQVPAASQQQQKPQPRAAVPAAAPQPAAEHRAKKPAVEAEPTTPADPAGAEVSAVTDGQQQQPHAPADPAPMQLDAPGSAAQSPSKRSAAAGPMGAAVASAVDAKGAVPGDQLTAAGGPPQAIPAAQPEQPATPTAECGPALEDSALAAAAVSGAAAVQATPGAAGTIVPARQAAALSTPATAPPAATPQATAGPTLQAAPPLMQPPAPPPPPLLPAEGPVTWDDWCEVLRRQPPLAPAPNQALHLYTRMALRQPVHPPAPSPDAAAPAANAQQQAAPPASGRPAMPSAAENRPQQAAKLAQVPMPKPNGNGPKPSSKPQQGTTEPAAVAPPIAAVGNGRPSAPKSDRLSGLAPMQLPPPDPRVPSAPSNSRPVKQEQGAAAGSAQSPLQKQEPAKAVEPVVPPPPPQQQMPTAPVHQQPASTPQQLPAALGQQPPAGSGALAATTSRAAEGKRRTGGTPAAPGSIAYNLLAGGKRQSGVPRRPASAAGGEVPPPHPVAIANAAVIAAGKPEGSLEERWADLGDAAELIAAAPDDEILGEILALQAELAAVMLANRAAIVPLVPKVLADLPAQAEAAAHRDACAACVRDYHMSQREVKRFFKREKREQQHREQAAAAEANAFQLPRSALGRQRGAFVDRPRSAPAPAPGAGKDPMVDALAEREEHEEALCAVCGGGHSEQPNEIVFCERCDVAVHQECYAVPSIPEGEWLCWPCKLYEEQQLAAGKSQAEIRKPRWEATASSPTSAPHAKPPGGSRDAVCMACPVRLGAFKRTADGGHWVHMVCALWQQGLQVADEPRCEVVSGKIPSEAFAQACSVCRKQEGATVKCGGKNCTQHVHPICARNSGGYLTTRDVGGRIVHRTFCQVHAEAARRRDRTAQEQAMLAAMGYLPEALPAGVAGPGPGKRKGAPLSTAAQERLRKGVEALATREAELEAIKSARYELETVRLALERISKRERLKLQLAKTHAQLAEAYLADPMAAARALGMDVGGDAAAEQQEVPRPQPQPSSRQAANKPLVVKLAIPRHAPAAGGSAAPAAAEAGASGLISGAPPAAEAQPAAAQQPALPAPLAAAGVGSKRKRDAAGRAGGTGKRKDSRRTIPRELALLQHEAAAAGAASAVAAPGLQATGPSLRASSLQGHLGADGAAAAGPTAGLTPLAAPAAAKQPRSRSGAAKAAADTPPGTPLAAAARRAAGSRSAGTPASVDGDPGTPRSTPGTQRSGLRRERGPAAEPSRGGSAKAKATAPHGGSVAKAKAAAAAPRRRKGNH